MKTTAPQEYHERLTPKYRTYLSQIQDRPMLTSNLLAFGCKRFVIDSGYYEALHRPNNDLNFDGIAEITEKGILTKEGQHYDCDVIVEATGFVVVRGLKSVSKKFR